MRAPLSPTAAVRRFTAIWGLSVAIKVAALAVFAYFVLKLLGGF